MSDRLIANITAHFTQDDVDRAVSQAVARIEADMKDFEFIPVGWLEDLMNRNSLEEGLSSNNPDVDIELAAAASKVLFAWDRWKKERQE